MFDLVIVKNAIRIALIVGVLLNIINNGEVVFSDGDWPIASIFLNFAIPFLVSLYSSANICRIKSVTTKE